MKEVTDTASVYEAERRVHHLVRPGFRITEMQIGPAQQVPWHYHNHVQDTIYVVSGAIRIELHDPTEEVRLAPGKTFAIAPRRPHRVTNIGDVSANFFVLQDGGEFDFAPIAPTG
jgi:mannose-6-phosphate isomerase-like protein (cupin superfamily)